MDLEAVKTYLYSRVGAVFSEEHAKRAISMLEEPEPEPTPPSEPAPASD